MKPITTILRPQTLDEFIGQEHLVGDENKILRKMIETNTLRSVIFYGPPGTGKTSLANIISNTVDCYFSKLNATTHGSKDIKDVLKQAETGLNTKQMVLFIDEITHLNKTQQNTLLEHTENGSIILIGATTENPFFSINGPLISRSQIFEFKPLEPKHIKKGIAKVIKYYSNNGVNVQITKKATQWVISMSAGDMRRAMNAVQSAIDIVGSKSVVIKFDLMKEIMPIKAMQFDAYGEEHYDYASAYQNAIQCSDPDAAIYWMVKWLESGENLKYVARRMMITASEDCAGNPEATQLAHNAYIAASEIGRPESDIIMAHATVVMASCPRDKSAAIAMWEAKKDIRNGVDIPIPREIRDCHYEGAESLGRGACHDGANKSKYVGINKTYYKPPTTNSYKNPQLYN